MHKDVLRSGVDMHTIRIYIFSYLHRVSNIMILSHARCKLSNQPETRGRKICTCRHLKGSNW